MSNEKIKTTPQSNMFTSVLTIGMLIISTGSGVLSYTKCKVDNKKTIM